MSARTLVLGLALALVCAGPPALAGARDDDVQDLVFFHDDQPIFFRLHVRNGDRSFQAVWREAIERLYAHLDSNGDGVLAPQEIGRGGWLDRMRSEDPRAARGRPAAQRNTPKTTPDSTPEVRNAGELAALLYSFYGPLQVMTVPKTEDGSETLFKQLDDDGDGKLSRAELDAAVAAFHTLDEDEDETVRARELRPYQNPFFGRNVMQPIPVAADAAPFVLLGPYESRTKLTRRLLDRYDKGSPGDPKEKDRKLSRAEAGLNEPVFREADSDADGQLDADELVHFLDNVTPHLELNVRSGKPIEVKTPPGPTSSHVRKTAGGGIALAIGKVEAELSPGTGAQNQFSFRDFYKNQFTAADIDRNKYLDEKESQNGMFNGNLAMMDRDGDGKLTEAEVLAFVDRHQEASDSRILLYYMNQGHSLFDFLDVNRDRRLSLRELREASALIAAWDHDGDGRVGADEIPSQFLLGFTRGQSPVLIRIGIAVVDRDDETTAVSDAGPKWFRNMDRNHDGDVSPGEFLGTRADFQRLDSDGNGLLDATEAAKTK